METTLGRLRQVSAAIADRKELELKWDMWKVGTVSHFIAASVGSKELVKSAQDILGIVDSNQEGRQKSSGVAENPPGSYERLIAGMPQG